MIPNHALIQLACCPGNNDSRMAHDVVKYFRLGHDPDSGNIKLLGIKNGLAA